jgi:hypothetical protein
VARLIGAAAHAHPERKQVSAWWLGRLSEGWHLVNDVPLGESGANIDHVLVGPPGVFTVNAKNLTGHVWVGASGIRVDGHATDFVRAAVDEATRAARLLAAALDRPVDVRPILAILADGWSVQEPHDDVFIGAPRGVKDWLQRLPSTLAPNEVARITAAAADPMTWYEVHTGYG